MIIKRKLFSQKKESDDKLKRAVSIAGGAALAIKGGKKKDNTE